MTEQNEDFFVVMDQKEIDRTLVRLAHEILEQNKGCENLALVGIVTRGDLLARKLADIIYAVEGVRVPVGSLDISFYRDDAPKHLYPQVRGTDIIFKVEGKTIVLVDDVLYTGRTIRAALDALVDLGRADRVQLAVLIDRGHRELPIRADYVGKNVPSATIENVRLYLSEVDDVEESCVRITRLHDNERAGSAGLNK